MSLKISLSRRRAGCFVTLFAAMTLLTGGASLAADDPELARSIVAKADEIRFPADGFQVIIDIVSTSPGEDPDERKYKVLSKGNQNTIVQTLEPAADRGQALLMRGRDLWVFMPNISQPVRLSLAQRLTGQVANGDLARANFSGDYEPKILRTDPDRIRRSQAARGESVELVDDLLAAAGWPNASSQNAVLIVGHQPTLGRVAARLLSGSASNWSVHKGAVWWVTSRTTHGETHTILRASLPPELTLSQQIAPKN